MEVKFDNNFVYVKTPYSDRNFVSQGLNGVWVKSKNGYRFPKNLHAMRELLRSYPQLRDNYSFVEAGKHMKSVQETFLELKKVENADGDGRLRPYQRVDVNYLKQLPSAGIFNEPRTGKTPTSIILMKEMNFQSTLVICPASLIWNWKKEFEKWYPTVSTFVVNGTPKQREQILQEFDKYLELTQPCVLIVSKDTWKKEYENWEKYTFDAVFVDEAHFLRNYKTKQSEAVFAVKAEHRYALTGTPTVKHSKDIWAILHFLYPEKFPSYWQFVDRYYVVEDTGYGKEIGEVKKAREAELQELVGFISVQRKRNEVMNWLPDKQKITHYAKMEKKQQKLYDAMVDVMFIDDEESEIIVDVANVLSQLLRLRQLCLDPRLLGFKETGAKTNALLEWLDDNREPVVIMSTFTSYFDIVKPEMEALGLKVGRLDGKMSNEEKDKAATNFQNGKTDVLLCNIISAGVGFTLDRAKVVIFMDKAWNPADNQQAEDRITPVSEERNHAHEIISFVIQDTVDEYINNMLEQKKTLTDVVNEGGREAINKLLGRP